MRLTFCGAIALAVLHGCGTSKNDVAAIDAGSSADAGEDAAVDPGQHAGIREAVERYLTTEAAEGEQELFARLDGEWKDVPFDVFEDAVRDRAPIELAAGDGEDEWPISATKRGRYYRYVPEALAGARKAVPLIVFLHGAGGGAEGITRDAGMRSVADELGAVLVAPVCDSACDWSANESCARQVVTLVQHLERVLPIDADRVVLSGFSMGGRGSFSVGAAYPGAFAGVVPGAGSIGAIRGSTDPAVHAKDCCPHTENFGATRLWFFTGANDLPELVAQNEGAAQCLTEQGATFRFEKIPGIGHAFRVEDWRPAVTWALEEPRERYPARVVYHLAPQLSGAIVGGAWFQDEVRWTPYWAFLLARKDPTAEARVEASHEGQEITVSTTNVARVALYLPSAWIASGPVRIRIDGTTVFDDRVAPDVRVLLREARERSDRSMTFAAKLELDVP